MHFAQVRMVRASPSVAGLEASTAGAASAGAASTAEASSAHIRVGGSDRKVACRAEHMPGMATRKGATPGESRRSRPT